MASFDLDTVSVNYLSNQAGYVIARFDAKEKQEELELKAKDWSQDGIAYYEYLDGAKTIVLVFPVKKNKEYGIHFSDVQGTFSLVTLNKETLGLKNGEFIADIESKITKTDCDDETEGSVNYFSAIFNLKENYFTDLSSTSAEKASMKFSGNKASFILSYKETGDGWSESTEEKGEITFDTEKATLSGTANGVYTETYDGEKTNCNESYSITGKIILM